MDSRSKYLLNNRPELGKSIVKQCATAQETFQNKTIRPIVLMQHELLIAVFKNYVARRKNVFYELPAE